MLNHLLRSPFRRSRTAPPTVRLEIRPPAAEATGWRERLSRWWQGPWRSADTLRPNRLQMIRGDFIAAIADIRHVEAAGMRASIEDTHSLRNLWHLRSAMFGLIARHVDQATAERRLERLNRHFPVRAPRVSGLVPFQAAATGTDDPTR